MLPPVLLPSTNALCCLRGVGLSLHGVGLSLQVEISSFTPFSTILSLMFLIRTLPSCTLLMQSLEDLMGFAFLHPAKNSIGSINQFVRKLIDLI